MSETWENWFGLVNSCDYYASPTRDIYQAMPYSVELWNPMSQTILNQYNFCFLFSFCFVFLIKDPYTSETIEILKNNLYDL